MVISLANCGDAPTTTQPNTPPKTSTEPSSTPEQTAISQQEKTPMEQAAAQSFDQTDIQTPADQATSVPASQPGTPDAAAKTETVDATDSWNGIVTRPTQLKATPDTNAATVTELPDQSPITVFERQGGWYRSATGGNRGWVRMLHVTRAPVTGDSSGAAELTAVADIATGRSGTGNVAATTGIRGFSAKDLSLAKPDPDRLAVADLYSVTRTEAASFAGKLGLESRSVAYLPEPKI
jgi:hypothetical protein